MAVVIIIFIIKIRDSSCFIIIIQYKIVSLFLLNFYIKTQSTMIKMKMIAHETEFNRDKRSSKIFNLSKMKYFLEDVNYFSDKVRMKLNWNISARQISEGGMQLDDRARFTRPSVRERDDEHARR